MSALTMGGPMDFSFGTVDDAPRRWSITFRGKRLTPDGDYTYFWGGQSIEIPDVLPDGLLRIDHAVVTDGWLTMQGELVGVTP